MIEKIKSAWVWVFGYKPPKEYIDCCMCGNPIGDGSHCYYEGHTPTSVYYYYKIEPIWKRIKNRRYNINFEEE